MAALRGRIIPAPGEQPDENVHSRNAISAYAITGSQGSLLNRYAQESGGLQVDVRPGGGAEYRAHSGPDRALHRQLQDTQMPTDEMEGRAASAHTTGLA